MSDIRTRIQAAFETDEIINTGESSIDVIENDVIRLEGSVTGIAAKRRALHVAREAASTPGIADHIRVNPEQRKNDDQLLDDIDRALRSDADFLNIPVGQGYRTADVGGNNWIAASTRNGVVMLEGAVPSLDHRRLAEVFSWWIPGVTDVDNRLHVEPPEEDNDGELRDALDLVLDKDQALDNQSINILVRDGKATLAGSVRNYEQRERVERNCWYVPGVHEVDNRLEIAAAGQVR